MTPRSFFIIVLKILGLFFLMDIVRLLPQLLSTLGMLLRPGTGIFAALLALISIGIYSLLVGYLLFAPHKIVSALRLDKHFTEDKFELSIQPSAIINISCIVIGAIIFLNNILPLITNTYAYIQARHQGGLMGMLDAFTGANRVSAMDLVQGLLLTLTGLLLVTRSAAIANLIEKQRQN